VTKVTVAEKGAETMRIESFMWTVLALLLAGGAAWDDAAGTQPLQTEEQIEAADSGTSIPPGP
jgi:hypothetical protein